MVQQARYQIRVYSPTTGGLEAIIDDFTSLEYHKKVNDVGYATLYFSLDTKKHDYFKLDSIIEVWRRPYASDWYLDYVGFHRTSSPQITEGNRRLFVSYSRSLLDLIKRRCILYKATTAYTLKGAAGETVIKEFVRENAGPTATAPPRLYNGATFGLSIETDSGRGSQWAGQRSYKNLLEVIQEVAAASIVDFDVVRTGTLSFEFRVYAPVLGTDRRSTIHFSPLLGNMGSPRYTKSRTDEINIIAVLGSEQGTYRKTYVTSSGAELDSPWNKCEGTYDARQETLLSGLITRAQEQLEALRAKDEFTFNVIQTGGTQYGVNYFLGDIVHASFEPFIEMDLKIIEVQVNVSEGTERIQVTFGPVPGESYYL